jgi:hypothetical protein
MGHSWSFSTRIDGQRRWRWLVVLIVVVVGGLVRMNRNMVKAEVKRKRAPKITPARLISVSVSSFHYTLCTISSLYQLFLDHLQSCLFIDLLLAADKHGIAALIT